MIFALNLIMWILGVPTYIVGVMWASGKAYDYHSLAGSGVFALGLILFIVFFIHVDKRFTNA
jgi:hypothetical protein